jgi:3-oxoacyl-[acyl-carrier protein] reductase
MSQDARRDGLGKVTAGRPEVGLAGDFDRLRGKVALVTGGSRGIGAAVALRLAAEGAQVSVTYPNADDGPAKLVAAARDRGYECTALEADNADPVAVRAAVRAVANAVGRVDILVNNAGVIRIGALDVLELEDFDTLFAVNVRGAFVASQEAARHMTRGGRIIMIGSCVADRMPFVGGSAYAMSKAALAGMARGLARDLGAAGITVNTVQPGPTNTDLNPAAAEEADSQLQLLAIDRFGQPDEVASLVAFLASEESAFITGASINIDGGFNT